VILDKLVEKKDIQVYINLRAINLWRNYATHKRLLRNPEISSKRKQKIQRGAHKLLGRIHELRYLNHVLNGSSFKKEGKKLWGSEIGGK
jgi:hypothetical protein